MRNEKNLGMHELIGLYVEIVNSTNSNQIGLRGKVIDETYHMLIIETEKGEKMIMKKGALFKFDVNGQDVKLKGDMVNYRPHERIKKLMRRKRRW